jgi:hypothetical protein
MFGAVQSPDANTFIEFYYDITVTIDNNLYELLTEQFYQQNSVHYSCLKHVERSA